MSNKLNLLFGISLILKLIVSAVAPVSLDEYYYYLWGRHLSLSYFDHPPLVGWIMSASNEFLSISEGTLRWPFVIISQLTVYIWYRILKDELKPKYMFWFVVTALLNPLWGMGGIIATPDIPLLFFWSLSLLMTKHLLSHDNLRNYFLFGLFLGAGFLAKYQIVLFLPALLWLLWQQRRFNLLFSYKTIITVFAGLLACSPVFLWNYQNDWASFVFQWQHGMSSENWSWSFPIEYLAAQFGLIFPAFMFFLIQKSGWLKHWLAPFAAFPLLFFLYTSFNGRVEANWPIMAYPAIYALAFLYVSSQSFVWMKRTNILWGSLLAILLLILPFEKQLPLKPIKLFESGRYTSFLEFVGPNETYLAYNYQLSALLSFKLDKLVCKFPKYGRVDHFNYLEPCKNLPEQFTYLAEINPLVDLQSDFPNYKIIDTQTISEKYVAIKMAKK